MMCQRLERLTRPATVRINASHELKPLSTMRSWIQPCSTKMCTVEMQAEFGGHRCGVDRLNAIGDCSPW